MIDWDRVAQLREEVGPEDFAEVVDLFLEEVDGVTARLALAPDGSRLRDDLHFLKGSALNLGFDAFSRLCQEGERAAARGSTPDLAALLRCYAVSREAFVSALATRAVA
ncbi:MAG: Hpt domain-containing protein [Rhodobacteraceae bacterium]|nr:Hpt domain-containing protein [Paracoccaceae bacterium]